MESWVAGKSARMFFLGRSIMIGKFVAVGAFAALAVAVAGPLQRVGALPQNAGSDASKATIKAGLDFRATQALACGRGGSKGNQGWGQGEPTAPGKCPSPT